MAAKTDTNLLAVTPVAGFRQATAAEVKAWAADNGFTVKPGRGRMPMEVVHAFNAKHGAGRKRKAQYVLGSAVQDERDYGYTTAKGRQGKFSARPADIRAWAQSEGLTTATRGKFSQEILDAYGQALRSK